MNNLSTQLGPEWTPVNIAIMVLLFLFGFWPLSAAMIAYVIWGDRIGLDLRRPASFSTLVDRLAAAFRGAKAGFFENDNPDIAGERPWQGGAGTGKPAYRTSDAGENDDGPDGRAHRWPPRRDDKDG
ncbi:MAG: hypothetical protein CSB44_06420 [Gammaproteobacteria bacterium]|nr:MAG: hypothetical protein CSB44_06420 [Gammaproteobacteria bacterium]